MSLYERLCANSHDVPADQLEGTGCWPWAGNRHTKGYGRLSQRVEHKSYPVKLYAHRCVLEELRGYNEFDLDDDPLGPIFYVKRPALDSDETPDHLCGNAWCWNPDHLEIVTRAENSRRRWQR